MLLGSAGLDSHAALAMVKHLVALTRLGHTIACSIHQPRQEIFNAFDSVLILSEGFQARALYLVLGSLVIGKFMAVSFTYLGIFHHELCRSSHYLCTIWLAF